MPANIKTPGVYIQENNGYLSPIIGVETAIPVFIGYTQNTQYDGKPLQNTPILINSINNYQQVFGFAPQQQIALQPSTAPNHIILNGNPYITTITANNYLLYNAIRLYFINGGQSCYIISVGDYTQPITTQALLAGLQAAENTQGITLIVCPEATLLADATQFATIANAMITQAQTLTDRFAILDVFNGDNDLNTTVIQDFRNNLNTPNPNYGAAYYPFLNTAIIAPTDINYTQIQPQSSLTAVLEDGLQTIEQLQSQNYSTLQINQYLYNNSPNYQIIAQTIATQLDVMPPSPIMAGLYAANDSNNGVWQSPANIAPIAVNSPTVSITNDQQTDLNAPLDGKAVNAIRNFYGRGTLVWGARTLDGNSNDFRYIAIRRTLIYIEQSIKAGLKQYVFSPNNSNTWSEVNTLVSNFLQNLWAQGGLVGSKPSDAYNVTIGLGTTMTSQDILNGYMILSVALALVHPAEYIVITISQQMAEA